MPRTKTAKEKTTTRVINAYVVEHSRLETLVGIKNLLSYYQQELETLITTETSRLQCRIALCRAHEKLQELFAAHHGFLSADSERQVMEFLDESQDLIDLLNQFDNAPEETLLKIESKQYVLTYMMGSIKAFLNLSITP